MANRLRPDTARNLVLGGLLAAVGSAEANHGIAVAAGSKTLRSPGAKTALIHAKPGQNLLTPFTDRMKKGCRWRTREPLLAPSTLFRYPAVARWSSGRSV